jgi:hypothetical protein
MANTLTWRPSALVAARAPFAFGNAAQAHALGQPAVSVQVRTAPPAALIAANGGALKINKCIGAAAAAPAAVDGTTTSLRQTVSAPRDEKVQGYMVKGGDARGIPPRGTPV